AVDLYDPEATRAAVDEAYRRLNGLNGLVCNAGVTLSKPFPDTALEDWHWAMNGNATSVYLTCHAALNYLRRNDRATIVNIGSAAAVQPLRGRAAYAASKAAVHAFTKVLAMELSPRIRCNVISPGAIDTPFVRNTFRDPDSIKRIEAMYALQRMGEPEEVARAALFLTSYESSFVTGTTMTVDGGRTYL
ncbi:MAG: SDR family NAD(P)-dependent oxidoreductase, partial [Pseudomonadales bacterium]